MIDSRRSRRWLRQTPIALLVAALLFACRSEAATNAGGTGKFGLGLIIGAPTAITGKAWLGGNHAIDGGFAFTVSDYLLLYGDYLVHFPGGFGRNNAFVARVTPYIGGGAIAAFTTRDRRRYDDWYLGKYDQHFALAARMPLGAEWMAPEIPLGVSLELAPAIAIYPGTIFFIQAGLAIRYYF